jgi:type I restriction enzyme M protein
MAKALKKNNGKRLATQQSVNSAVKSICDIMRRSNCAEALAALRGGKMSG